MYLLIGLSCLLPFVYAFWCRKQPKAAFLSLLPSIIGFVALGIVMSVFDQDPAYFLVSMIGATFLLILSLIALATIPYEISFEKAPWPRTWARMIFGVARDLFILLGLLFFLNYLGLILFALLMGAGLRSKKAVSYSQALEIVSVLYHAAGKNLPIAAALNIASQNEESKAAPTMQRIAHWLVQGYPLAEALDRGWPKAPPHVVSMIRAAEKVNQLPHVLESLLEDMAERTDEFRRIQPVGFAYPVVLLVFASLILLGLMVFIVPTFAEVLSDMSDGTASLPASTQFLLNLSNTILGRKGLNFVIMMLAGLGIGSFLLFLRRMYLLRAGFICRFVDWIKWHLPIIGKIERDTALLASSEYLQAALRVGMPVHQALKDLGQLSMNSCFQRKTARWAAAIEQGRAMGQAAREVGMGRTLTWAMNEKLNGRNLPVILKMLEEITRSRCEYRMNLMRAVTCPLMVLALGAFVGFIVYAMFIPMVQMITFNMTDFIP